MKIVLYEFPGDGIPEEDEYDVDDESIHTPNRSISQIKNPNNNIHDSNLNILLKNNPKIEKINLDKEEKKLNNKSDNNIKSYLYDDTENNLYNINNNNNNSKKTQENPNKLNNNNDNNNININTNNNNNNNNCTSTFDKSKNKLKEFIENIKNDNNNNFINTNINISQDDILMEEDILFSEINDNLKTPNINSINSNRFLSKSKEKEFNIKNEEISPLRKNKVKFNNTNNNNCNENYPNKVKSDKEKEKENNNYNSNYYNLIKFNSKKSRDSKYDYSIISNTNNFINSSNTFNENNEFSDEKNTQLKKKIDISAENLDINKSRSKSVFESKIEYIRKNKSNDFTKDKDNEFNINSNLKRHNTISQKDKIIFNKEDIIEFLKFKEMKKNLKLFFEKLKDLFFNFTSCISILDQSYSWIQKRYLKENLKRITRSYKEKKKSM
jgi:hypothetical protein